MIFILFCCVVIVVQYLVYLYHYPTVCKYKFCKKGFKKSIINWIPPPLVKPTRLRGTHNTNCTYYIPLFYVFILFKYLQINWKLIDWCASKWFEGVFSDSFLTCWLHKLGTYYTRKNICHIVWDILPNLNTALRFLNTRMKNTLQRTSQSAIVAM